MLIHSAYERDLKISEDTPHWIFDQCVFFVYADHCEDTADIIEASYTPHDAAHVFVLRAEGELLDVSCLVMDEQAEAEMLRRWGSEDFMGRPINHGKLLNGTSTRAVDEIEDGGWHLQRIRAQAARRMGYLGVIDWDEQGEVVIVDFAERNDELNACWQYIGEL